MGDWGRKKGVIDYCDQRFLQGTDCALPDIPDYYYNPKNCPPYIEPGKLLKMNPGWKSSCFFVKQGSCDEQLFPEFTVSEAHFS